VPARRREAELCGWRGGHFQRLGGLLKGMTTVFLLERYQKEKNIGENCKERSGVGSKATFS